jgi:corrinoid protein of di/trimethylamine methyltransferase
MSELLKQINESMQIGKAKLVKQYCTEALEAGISPTSILNDGLLSGMTEVGEKFKEGTIFVPEVLVAARAMNKGLEIIRPLLVGSGQESKGTAVIGTVQGDLHDIGKNLVRMMMESRGINVIDLGADVAPETFYQTAIDNNAQIVCCSALLTTTMKTMRTVVELFENNGNRDKVKIMVGGAPLSQAFCDSIGADCYTEDASSAAEAAMAYLS